MVQYFSPDYNTRDWIKMSASQFYKMTGHHVMSGILKVFSRSNQILFQRIKGVYGTGMSGFWLVRPDIFSIWSLVTSKGESDKIELPDADDSSNKTQPRHLYLVKQPHGLVKIGISKDFPARLKNIEGDCGMPMDTLFLSVILPYDVAYQIEQSFMRENAVYRMLQKKSKFSHQKKKTGEWFFLDDNAAIESLIKIAKKEIEVHNEKEPTLGLIGLPPSKPIPCDSIDDLTLFSFLEHPSWEPEWEKAYSDNDPDEGQLKIKGLK